MSSDIEFIAPESDGEDFILSSKKKMANEKGKGPTKPRKPYTKKAKTNENPLVEDRVEGANIDFHELGISETSPKIKGSSKNEKTLEQIYQKKTQLEHILLRPDTYIGSTEHNKVDLWVFNEETKLLEERNVNIVPGLYKIFDEILVNAADNKIRDPSMSKLKVTIDQENNKITIYNNGKGIPIQIHKEEKIYIPELIFGNLLTSSNYDDSEKKVVGGRNGYGAKLCNIFSEEFIVETGDREVGKKYFQRFSKNMTVVEPPKITSYSKGEEFTSITFKPDLSKFNMDRLDDDIVALMKKRVYDMSGTVEKVSVYLNGQVIPIKDFKQYCSLYLKSSKKESESDNEGSTEIKDEDEDKGENKADKDIKRGPKIIYEKSDRWEIGFIPHDKGTFQQVSFVNSICTSKGGTHVSYVSDKIIKKIAEALAKKKVDKNLVKIQHIKNNIWVFIKCLIENPSFDSQTKENMTLKASSFGSQFEISDKFMNSVIKSGIIASLEIEADIKAKKKMLNTMDSVKRTRITGIPKLEDANWAGTSKSSQCTLILTEGDSAKSLAIAGLSEVGRDRYGVFPLRGKLLNVRDASTKQITENAELQNICKILGLNSQKDYKDIKSLRYGHIMIMTDQDHDGSHIKGLLINYIDHFYPTLLKVPGFMQEFITPIVKAYKGREVIPFFTIPEYNIWKELPENKNHKSKYFKGLATSDSKDAKEYFRNINLHRKTFREIEPNERKLIDLAFNKKKADARKEWLKTYHQDIYIDQSGDYITYDDFINKELIQFSMADNIRSIPNIMDGFKPGQRKILFGCFKRDLKEEIRVAQLIGYISENTAYHHGELSLASTIIGLAQNFVGSNNLNLLEPRGIFGSREKGGKDAGAPRYIHTALMEITKMIFHKDDMPLLNYLKEDGLDIEPFWYAPIVPMILINGAEGIGTGWSTFIPKYNPLDLIENLRRIMKDLPMVEMIPWYRGFIGKIEEVSPGKFTTSGIIKRTGETTVRITELPIGVWNLAYKNKLEDWLVGKDSMILDYKCYTSEATACFEITLKKEVLDELEKEGLEKSFKLITQLNTTNMVAFSPQGTLLKYESPLQIIEQFYTERIKLYVKRKDYLLKTLGDKNITLSAQIRFISEVIKGNIEFKNRTKNELIDQLQTMEFPALYDSEKIKHSLTNGYNYLLNMPIWNLTIEKMDSLKAQQEKLNAELNLLRSKSPIDLWNDDLDSFIEAWKKLLEEDKLILEMSLNNIGESSNKKLRAKSKIKSEKSLVLKKDVDNDIEVKNEEKVRTVPVKHIYKKKNKIENQNNTGIESFFMQKEKETKTSDTSAKPIEKKAKRAIEISDSDDDPYMIPISERLKSKKSTEPPVKKVGLSPKSDSSPVRLNPRRGISSAKKVIEDSDDDDFKMAPRELPKRASRAKVSYVYEQPEGEEEEEEEAYSDSGLED